MNWIIGPGINWPTIRATQSRNEGIEIRGEIRMLLQKRKNIQGNSSLFKTVHIPFDKLTDSFVLRKTVYHETSFVKFRDEVTYNMPV